MKKLSLLFSLLAIFIAADGLCFGTGSVAITESPGASGHGYLDFTLSTADAGIIEFMVGNNDAYRWGTTIESSDSALANWHGYMMERPTDDVQWFVMDQNVNYDSSWIASDNELFAGYTKAFLWTAYHVFDGYLDGAPLGIGTYSTFIGQTLGEVSSPFAVNYSGLEETLYGETDETTNALPEPLTILLLGIGLMGVAGIRRKLNM